MYVSRMSEDSEDGQKMVSTSTPPVKYNWVNVTDDFLSAASGLALGELLHDSK